MSVKMIFQGGQCIPCNYGINMMEEFTLEQLQCAVDQKGFIMEILSDCLGHPGGYCRHKVALLISDVTAIQTVLHPVEQT